jgi:hypothetical protein
LKMTDSRNQVTYYLIGNVTTEGFELSTEPTFFEAVNGSSENVLLLHSDKRWWGLWISQNT